MDCFYCLSLWVAVPIAWVIGREWKEQLFLWLGCSAAAILLERITKRDAAMVPAQYFEDKEEDHVMLRKSKDAVAGDHTTPGAS